MLMTSRVGAEVDALVRHMTKAFGEGKLEHGTFEHCGVRHVQDQQEVRNNTPQGPPPAPRAPSRCSFETWSQPGRTWVAVVSLKSLRLRLLST